LLFGSQRALKTVEDFTEFEQRTAYFDGDTVIATKKGVNPLERGSQVDFMADFQEMLDFPPAPKLDVLGKLDPTKATAAEMRGQEVFVGKGQCASCHQPPFYTDNLMHNLQTERFFKPVMINRMMAIGDGPIKTFSLRGVKDNPPYLHDERLLTLEDTVEFFNLILGTKLAPQEKQELVAFVVYDRYPGLVLVVAPSHNGEIKSIKDLAGKKVGVSAPGSSTDFFLKYLLKKNGLDPASASVIGVGLGATAVAAMEQGQIDAAVMLDPSVTVLQGSHPDLRILSDTRTQKDTLEVFGGEYPGGALYSTIAWVNSHEKDVQALATAMLNTLAWIHSHSAEDIMAKMPPEIVGKNKELYLAALKNTIPMYSTTGAMDPKGAEAVLALFSQSSPDVANAKIDLSKTYTNKFVDQANAKPTN